MVKRPLLLVSLSFMIGIVLNENIIWTALFAVFFLSCFIIDKKYRLLIALISISFLFGTRYIKVYDKIYSSEIEEYNGKSSQIIGIVYDKLNESTYLIKNVVINSKKIKSNIFHFNQNVKLNNCYSHNSSPRLQI